MRRRFSQLIPAGERDQRILFEIRTNYGAGIMMNRITLNTSTRRRSRRELQHLNGICALGSANRAVGKTTGPAWCLVRVATSEFVRPKVSELSYKREFP
jgi:hypothetical protein